MKIEIKNQWNGDVIYSHECENNSMRITLLKAISEEVDVSNSNLRGCNLSDCDLRYTDFRSCDMSGVNFTRSDLRYCDLSSANLARSILNHANMSYCILNNTYLTRADLRNVDLSDGVLDYCDLTGSDLRECDLRDCDLRYSFFNGCDLRGVDFYGCDLRGADLTPIRDDIWAVLSSAPNEVPGLISAIKEGRVDGSTYEGACACLVGTIANVKHVKINSITGVTADSLRPAERFFMGIEEWDTPETSQFSALALQWCEEWLNRMQEAFGNNT